MARDNKFVKSLIQNAQDGNNAAYEQLYQLNAPRVFALCLRLTGKSSLAEDLTKRTFIGAWTEITLFDENLSFSEWISGIAVSLTILEIKNKKEIQPANYQSAFEGLDKIDQEILKLNDYDRICFTLHDIEKYSYEKISEKTGLPVEQCRKLTADARFKLLDTIK